jgi:hypothetical protein
MRLALRRPLGLAADLATLRQHYEAFVARLCRRAGRRDGGLVQRTESPNIRCSAAARSASECGL